MSLWLEFRACLCGRCEPDCVLPLDARRSESISDMLGACDLGVYKSFSSSSTSLGLFLIVVSFCGPVSWHWFYTEFF